MIYVAIIVDGGDFVATFLVHGQYFLYGNTFPNSGSNKRLNQLQLLHHRISYINRGGNSVCTVSH